MNELLQQLRQARWLASAGEQERARALIENTRLTIGAMSSTDLDKPTLRAARAHIAEAGLAVVMRDYARSVSALDNAIETLEPESRHDKEGGS